MFAGQLVCKVFGSFEVSAQIEKLLTITGRLAKKSLKVKILLKRLKN